MVIPRAYIPMSMALAEPDSLSTQITVMGVVVAGAVLLALFGVFVVLMVVPFASLTLRRRRPRQNTGPTMVENGLPDGNRKIGPRHAAERTAFTRAKIRPRSR